MLNLPRGHGDAERGKNALIQVVETSSTSTHIAINVQEAYREYQPPFDFKSTVERLLATVPEKYLIGLDCVVLVNQSGLPRRDRVGKTWSRKRKVDKLRILGRYHPRWHNSLPYIELRVDKILLSLETTAGHRIKLLREIAIGHILFHEIGHHIHATARPEHAEKEDVADRWAAKLNRNFIRKKYWYLLPLIIPTFWIYRFSRRKEWI
jgi:hypothetical protein